VNSALRRPEQNVYSSPLPKKARSIGAQCKHQLHFAPDGANHLDSGRAINMLLLRSKDPVKLVGYCPGAINRSIGWGLVLSLLNSQKSLGPDLIYCNSRRTCGMESTIS